MGKGGEEGEAWKKGRRVEGREEERWRGGWSPSFIPYGCAVQSSLSKARPFAKKLIHIIVEENYTNQGHS